MTDDESEPVMMQWKGLDKRRESSSSSNMDMDLAPPPPSPPPPKRIKQLEEEEEDHEAMEEKDDDDEDQYQGCPLMELLAVQLAFHDNDYFYGEIKIRDRFGEQTVYERDWEHGEPVRTGECLLLTDPKKRCVRADGEVIIEAETKDGLHRFKWSPDIFGPSFKFYPMYGMSTLRTIGVGQGSTTALTLEYVVYRMAVQAVVTVRLIDDGCGGDGGAIFGSISAYSSNLDDTENVLFKEKSGGKGTRVLPGKLIQLSRSVISVPLDGPLLVVEADLLSYGNKGKDAVVIAKGRASFDPWYFGAERVDSSGRCGKIRVRVTWKCSPSDPTSEDLSDVHDDRNGDDDDFEELGVWTDTTPVDNGGQQQQLPEPSASPQPLPEPDREDLLSDFKQNGGVISWPLARDLFIRYRMSHMIGSMLAEVFEVRNGGVGGSFFGMIVIVADAGADVIYRSDWENRAFVCADSSLPLAGPARSIIAYKPFSIYVKLSKEEDSSHGLKRFEYREHIKWDPYRWDDCYKLLEEKVMGNDDGQPVIVKYAVFGCAIQATVEVWLKLRGLGSPKIALDVNGSVTARYNKYLSNSSMPLFEKSLHEPRKLALAFGDPIPLRRSVVSVPLYSLLIVEANLHDGIANGVDGIDNGFVRGKAEFVPRCIGWFQEKTIAGPHGEILVRVSWKSYAP